MLEAPVSYQRAPKIGEHNEEILSGLLGMAPDLRPALILAVVFIVFSEVIVISPHYYRTLVTYVVAVPAMFVLVRDGGVRLGFFLIAGTVIWKLLGSEEEKGEPEVKIGWKS